MAAQPEVGLRVRLRELIVPSRGPMSFGAHAWFDRYSVAAFGSGRAETVRSRGRDACLVQPGDVLVSRSLTAPRRAWVVGSDPGRPQIASGEWLVLRSDAYDGNYLRHLLVSNELHLRFCAAAAGAVRARSGSAALGAIELPCPDLPRQNAIARLLDQVEALRAKRRRALCALDDYTAAWRHAGSEAASRSCAESESAPAAALLAAEDLRRRMEASAKQLDALLAVLRDRVFRGEVDPAETGDAHNFR